MSENTSALERLVERTRRALSLVELLRIAVVGVAAGALGLLGFQIVALFVARGSTDGWQQFAQTMQSGAVQWGVALSASIAVGVVMLSRRSQVSSLRAALWLEERVPCNHALVTLTELTLEPPSGGLPEATAERLAAQAAAVGQQHAVPPALRRVAWRRWKAPTATVIASIVLMLVLSIVSERTASARPAFTLDARARAKDAATTSASRLSSWRIEVVSPAYSRLPAQQLTDSSTVTALVGSRVRISGTGDTAGLSATWIAANRESTSAMVSQSDNAREWRVQTAMPGAPSALRLQAGTESRVLTLVPRRDSLPVVQLLSPLRDSVFRDTVGSILLRADASDDLGLRTLAFDVILTSGAGEQYTAKTLTLGYRDLSNEKRGSASATVNFGVLGIKTGDVLHVRALARDNQPLAGRDAGVSETRSFRFARAGEYDSVAVEAAPPPAVDSSMLSQRMLLELTLKLDARRPRLAREVLVAESRSLAAQQAKIRRAVSAIVFQRFSGDGESEHVHYEGDGHDHGLAAQDGKLVPSYGGAATSAGAPSTGGGADATRVNNNASDESPIIAVNRPLLEAYNAMWDAGRALELADTKGAIPPMRLALEAIQRARAAERVYLRGRTRAIVVDLDKVRLAGRDTGASSLRPAGSLVTRTSRLRADRLLHAAELLAVAPTAARDSLVLLRLDALGSAPEFVLALEQLLSALTAGEDATAPLVRARRALVPVRVEQGAPRWSTP